MFFHSNTFSYHLHICVSITMCFPTHTKKKKSILLVPCALGKMIISSIPSVQFLTAVLNFGCYMHLVWVCAFTKGQGSEEWYSKNIIKVVQSPLQKLGLAKMHG